MTRTIAMLAALAAALLLPAASHAADGWNANTFRSPTGNLVCKYRGWTGTLACGAYSSQKIVALHAHGRPVQGRLITLGDEAPHSFPYGQTWHTNGYQITCSSRYDGIRCVNLDGWAFLIDRSTIKVQWHGAYAWSL